MRANVLTGLIQPRAMSWLSFRGFLVVLGAAMVVFFVGWVKPSLELRSSQAIGADSALYMQFGRDIHAHTMNPAEMASLFHFPNNLWAPVLFVVFLRSTVLIALVNLGLFSLSVSLLARAVHPRVPFFVLLLLMNPTTLVSILTVNKEIMDLLIVSLFVFGLTKHRRILIFLALALSTISRIELGAIMLLFIFANSRFNPLRQRRFLGFVSLLLLISVALPIAARGDFASRFQEASQGSLVTLLDRLQMHFLYFAVYVPKLLENLFVELVNPSKWAVYSSWDLANSYIIFLNNLCNLILLVVLVRKRTLSLQSDVVYLALLGSAVMTLSFVIQPRYFYFMYVLLCLEAARDLPVQRYRVRLPFTVAQAAC